MSTTAAAKATVQKCRYLTEQDMYQRTGLAPEIIHQTFLLADADPKLQIKKKTGQLVWHSNRTTKEFIRLAKTVSAEHPASGGQPKGQVTPPRLVVPIMQFACACERAIAQANGVKLVNGNPERQGLMRFTIVVTAGGASAKIRLDIAAALVKRKSHLPFDAYGDRIVGAMTDEAGERWIVAYDDSCQLDPAAMDAANIDHLIPRAQGGSSALCNLHVMRTRNNSSKSDVPMPDISGEPQASIRVLRLLAEGCRTAMADGLISDVCGRALLAVVRDDLYECMAMMPAGKVAVTTLACVASRLSPSRLLARRGGGSIRDAARVRLSQVAAAVLSAG